MPAPIDWSAAGGLDSVKQLTQQVGPREASRRLGLSPQHSDALRQICHRGRWLADVQRPNVTKPVTGPVTVAGQPVSAVTTASEALSDSLADDSRETRLSLSRGARRMSAQVETADMDRAGDALQVAKLASITHGWEAKGPGAAVMVNVNLLGMPVEHLPPADQVLLIDQP